MKLLVVVDMQDDFINGSLGTDAAKAIVPNVVKKIKESDRNTLIIFTQDTHFSNYEETLEGKLLPVHHCRFNTAGWMIHPDIREARIFNVKNFNDIIHDAEFRNDNTIIKNTFGSTLLMNYLIREGHNFDEIEFVGLCSDICVVSNVLMARAALPNTPITVDASCCAGTTPERHKAALEVMKSCQIDVINEE